MKAVTWNMSGVTYRDAPMRVPGHGTVLLTSERDDETGSLLLYAWVGIPLTDRSYLLRRRFEGVGYQDAVRTYREVYADHVEMYERGQV